MEQQQQQQRGPVVTDKARIGALQRQVRFLEEQLEKEGTLKAQDGAKQLETLFNESEYKSKRLAVAWYDISELTNAKVALTARVGELEQEVNAALAGKALCVAAQAEIIDLKQEVADSRFRHQLEVNGFLKERQEANKDKGDASLLHQHQTSELARQINDLQATIAQQQQYIVNMAELAGHDGRGDTVPRTEYNDAILENERLGKTNLDLQSAIRANHETIEDLRYKISDIQRETRTSHDEVVRADAKLRADTDQFLEERQTWQRSEANYKSEIRELKTLREEIASALDKQARIQKEKDAVERTNANLRKQVRERDETILAHEDLHATLTTLGETVATQSDVIHQLEQELADARSLPPAEMPREFTAAPHGPGSDLEDLDGHSSDEDKASDNERPKTRKQSKQVEKQEHDTVANKVVATADGSIEEIATLESLIAEQTKSLQEQAESIHQLEEQVLALKSLEAVADENAALKATSAEQSRKLQQHVDTIHMLEADLMSFKAVETAVQENSELKATSIKQTQRLHKQTETIRELQENVRTLRALEPVAEENSTLKTVSAKQTKEIQQQTETIHKLEEQVLALKSLEPVADENATLKAVSAQQSKDLREQTEKLHRLEEELAGLKAQEPVTKQEDATTDSMSDSPPPPSTLEVNVLRQEIQELKQQHTAEQMGAREALNKANSDHDSTMRALAKTRVALDTKQAELDAVNADVAAATEIADLRLTVADLREKHQAAIEEQSATKAALRKAQTDLLDLQADMQDSMTEKFSFASSAEGSNNGDKRAYAGNRDSQISVTNEDVTTQTVAQTDLGNTYVRQVVTLYRTLDPIRSWLRVYTDLFQLLIMFFQLGFHPAQSPLVEDYSEAQAASTIPLTSDSPAPTRTPLLTGPQEPQAVRMVEKVSREDLTTLKRNTSPPSLLFNLLALLLHCFVYWVIFNAIVERNIWLEGNDLARELLVDVRDPGHFNRGFIYNFFDLILGPSRSLDLVFFTLNDSLAVSRILPG
ncbi:MAG: hypothetical protein M1818_007718 [Claussenomyces sp. TS43310]|nr:MAG: hypothetical protein M1818_007718 [Claussenomyces sp. TS43310]